MEQGLADEARGVLKAWALKKDRIVYWEKRNGHFGALRFFMAWPANTPTGKSLAPPISKQPNATHYSKVCCNAPLFA